LRFCIIDILLTPPQERTVQVIAASTSVTTQLKGTGDPTAVTSGCDFAAMPRGAFGKGAYLAQAFSQPIIPQRRNNSRSLLDRPPCSSRSRNLS
jgi:hypothetical protein